jgi:hypothetical protein
MRTRTCSPSGQAWATSAFWAANAAAAASFARLKATKKASPLRIDLATARLLEDGPEDSLVLFEDAGVAFAESPEQSCTADG